MYICIHAYIHIYIYIKRKFFCQNWLSQFQWKKSSSRAKALPRLLRWGKAAFFFSFAVCSALFNSDLNIPAGSVEIWCVFSCTCVQLLYSWVWWKHLFKPFFPELILCVCLLNITGGGRFFFLFILFFKSGVAPHPDRNAGGWTEILIRTTMTQNLTTMWWKTLRRRTCTCLQGQCIRTMQVSFPFTFQPSFVFLLSSSPHLETIL